MVSLTSALLESGWFVAALLLVGEKDLDSITPDPSLVSDGRGVEVRSGIVVGGGGRVDGSETPITHFNYSARCRAIQGGS